MRRLESELPPQPEARRLPIIAITANALGIDRERCLAAGMDVPLGKPFHRSDLQAVLERWLGPAA